MKAKPLFISTDPGIDDAAAVTICLFAQELDVRLLVPTWGNVALNKTLRNTLQLETFLGTHIPVVAGSRRPLVRDSISAADVHGKSGLDGWTFPEPDQRLLKSGIAVDAIHRVISQSTEKVTLMAIGPLTDLSLFIHQYPEDLSSIDRIVIMGGAIGRGNYSPLAEYNFAADPEAARIVFNSSLPIQVAPLEIAAQARILASTSQRIKALGPVGQMMYQLFDHLHDGTIARGLEIYDALAAGLLLDPEMFTLTPAHVEIETSSQHTYGASVIDFDAEAKSWNAEIATKSDADSFASWFYKRLADTERKAVIKED